MTATPGTAAASTTPATRPSPTVTMLRPIGSSLPLGFLALAVATFSFAVLQLGWIPKNQGSTIALAVLISTVPLQALVSVLAFAARDTAPGTAMGLLAGTWGGICLATLTSKPGAPSEGLGTFLLAAGACLLVPATAALPRIWAPVVIGTSGVRFILTGVAQLDGSTSWLRVAGWAGLALALVSFAAALVLVLQRSSVEDVGEEPGVRRGT
ncbi:MAG: hypothetical protein ACJ72L_20580 [Marmoricola sp.]